MKSQGIRFDIDSEARRHFTAFVDAFVSAEMGERWVTLFDAARSAAWRKIDPWKMWEPSNQRPGRHYEELDDSPAGAMAAIAKTLPQDAAVLIFHLGHSTPGVRRVLLSECSGFGEPKGQVWPLEGLVSIVPGRQAMVRNHDGGTLLCRL